MSGRRHYIWIIVLVGLVALVALSLGESWGHFWLGQIYEKRGMKAHAIREYHSALERDPDYDKALLRLAVLYDDQNQYVYAFEPYRRFLTLYPDSAAVRLRLGDAYVRARRYDEAVETYKDIVKLRPQWMDLWIRLGHTYTAMEQFLRAIQAYRRALEINPDSSSVRFRLAVLYQKQGDIEAAIREWIILVEDFPDNPQYHIRLADLLVEQEETGRKTVRLEQTARTRLAEMHMLRAVELSPDYIHPRWSLGFLLARQGRYAQAIEHFQKILALTREDYYVHKVLANLYHRTGREEEARQHVEVYLQADRTQQVHEFAIAEIQKQIERLLGK